MTKRVFSREFKLAAVKRLAAGEKAGVLARELGIRVQNLHYWRDRFREGGAAALFPDGRPRKSDLAAMHSGEVVEPWTAAMPPPDPPDELDVARARIAELERKVGRQELELDFFQQALRRVEAGSRRGGVRGGMPSTRSSK